MLDLGRVVAVHPESHSVDLVMVKDGRRLTGIPVMSHSASGNTGFNALVKPTVTNAGSPFESDHTGVRDIVAVVGQFGASPIVLGFLFPQVSQCLFADENRAVFRHASDLYWTVDGDGNTEMHHPSGTYVRIGTSPDHEDLTGKDYDKQWNIKNNTDTAPFLRVQIANAGQAITTLEMSPHGDVGLDTPNTNLSISKEGAVNLAASKMVNIHANEHVTISAHGITLNAPSIVCTGDLTVAGDVTAGDVSLIHHVHGGVKSGANETGEPV